MAVLVPSQSCDWSESVLTLPSHHTIRTPQQIAKTSEVVLDDFLGVVGGGHGADGADGDGDPGVDLGTIVPVYVACCQVLGILSRILVDRPPEVDFVPGIQMLKLKCACQNVDRQNFNCLVTVPAN